MNRAHLAALIVKASNAERESFLRDNSALADSEFAYILKEICLDGWSTHPAQALGAAAALQLLSQLNADEEITALAAWAAGLESLIGGQMERAIKMLDDSRGRFLALDRPRTAAATQVSKLIALAMLSRYDEAVECGLAAREVFLASGDILAAGKIEHNIGNIYFRRDRYQEAERFQRTARERFLAVGEQTQIAKIENSLALTLSQQHKIKEAEQLYQQALERAAVAGLVTTQAEIESSIGTLALFQGRYDRALDYLERSRRKYIELNMPHLSAMTYQEIADAYLELNLAPEAAEIYERIAPCFAELGMRAEEAHALAYNARAAILLGQTQKARALLSKARELYFAEGNEVGVALVTLSEAQLFYDQSNYEAAVPAASQAERALASACSSRPLLIARWLTGELARAMGQPAEARRKLEETLSETESQGHSDIAARCHTSLGLLAEQTDNRGAAEASFRKAVAIIEALRAPLPAEHFRTTFFANKLVPYHELVRLCLAKGKDHLDEAFGFVERTRARALADTLGGNGQLESEPRDAFESELRYQLGQLRGELNYFYNRINRVTRGDQRRDEAEMAALRVAARDRESKTLEVMRQLQHRGAIHTAPAENLDLKKLRHDLGPDTALVEYASLGDELLAFVLTHEAIGVVRNLASYTEITAELGQLRFQIDALRYGSAIVRKHLPDLTRRAQRHSAQLYRSLIAPIEERTNKRHFVIVPHRALHYLPFHALFDGESYLIERHEISYAPSAAVFVQCLARPTGEFRSALLVGVADDQTPLARDEVKMLAPLFSDAVTLLDDEATISSVREHASSVDVLHLACHGQFRPDNPLFSSLRLGDGWMTVRDAFSLKLRSRLVTLSACETGVGTVAPGDELVGLARAFFSAGTPSLLMSLWTVDDEATTQLMGHFYAHLLQNNSPVAALRFAQIKVMEANPHPFFWSPFILVGRP
jgi:CHAT domain-containing protein